MKDFLHEEKKWLAVDLKLILGSGTSIGANYSSGKLSASSSFIVGTGMLGMYVRFNESIFIVRMLSLQLNHIYMLQYHTIHPKSTDF